MSYYSIILSPPLPQENGHALCCRMHDCLLSKQSCMHASANQKDHILSIQLTLKWIYWWVTPNHQRLRLYRPNNNTLSSAFPPSPLSPFFPPLSSPHKMLSLGTSTSICLSYIPLQLSHCLTIVSIVSHINLDIIKSSDGPQASKYHSLDNE